MAGGIGNFSGTIGNDASQVLKNLQQLIAQNPAYLTSGIPTHLIQQMYMNNDQPKVINSRPAYDVCFGLFIIYFYLVFYVRKNSYNLNS